MMPLTEAAVVMRNPEARSRAICDPANMPEGLDPDSWFASNPNGKEGRAAKEACLNCPLMWQCGEYALEEGVPYGIFGGLDPDERARAWKRQGGRPRGFLDVLEHHAAALLQERRNQETALAVGDAPEGSDTCPRGHLYSLYSRKRVDGTPYIQRYCIHCQRDRKAAKKEAEAA